MKRNFSCGLLFLLWMIHLQAQLIDQSKNYPAESISSFAERLEPVGRILEEDNYYVWCCAPVMDEDRKVHVF